jgi:flagellar hook-associated protein 2
VRSAQLASGVTSGGTLQIESGGTAISVAAAAGDSLDEIAAAINSASGTPVYASVVDDKLYVTARKTGSDAALDFTGTTGALQAELGLADSVAAQNALYRLDGDASDRVSQTNEIADAIVGVSLTLKSTTTSAVTVTVGEAGPDEEAVKAKVQAFVDAYNTAVDFIRARLSERRVRDPETQADLKKGALAGDSGLTQLLGSLRQSVSDVLSGRPAEADSLAEVGLSTGGGSGGTASADAVAGRLVLDSAKLSEQLAARFADVKSTFTSETGAYASEGLAQRAKRLLDPFLVTGGVLDGRIDAQDRTIASLKQRSADLDVRLGLREKALRARFTALETSLAQLQSQNSWLTGQLAGL